MPLDERQDRVCSIFTHSKDFVETVLNAIPDIFCVLDSEGKPVLWKSALARVTGYDNAEIGGMKAQGFFQRDEESRIQAAIASILTTGRSIVTADLVTKAGDRKPYEFSGTALKDHAGAFVGIDCMGRDLRERGRRT